MAWQKIGDHTLILGNSEHKSNHHLDEFGGELWKVLEKKLTLDQLVIHTTQQYEVDETTARKDIEVFIKKLTSLHLLEEIND